MTLNMLCSSFFQNASDNHDIPWQRSGQGLVKASSIFDYTQLVGISSYVLGCLNCENPTIRFKKADLHSSILQIIVVAS